MTPNSTNSSTVNLLLGHSFREVVTVYDTEKLTYRVVFSPICHDTPKNKIILTPELSWSSIDLRVTGALDHLTNAPILLAAFIPGSIQHNGLTVTAKPAYLHSKDA